MQKIKNKLNKILKNMRNFYDRNRKYLPSRNFMIVFGAIAAIFVLFLSISLLVKLYRTHKVTKGVNSENIAQKNPENQTIQELLQNDTDRDGVLDWEEALWGTNKRKPATFNGVPDQKYIEEKRAELKVEDEKDDKTLTETEKFAREFFSTYAAMKSSGVVDDETIQNFSAALGERISTPDLADKYTRSDIQITKKDDLDQAEAYYTTVSDIFAKYQAKGLGDEVEIMDSGLESYKSEGTSNPFNQLSVIAQAYKDFASSVVRVPVPESLLSYHLRIVNGAHSTGVSVSNMSQAVDDPIISVSGVSEYEKYSEEFIKAVEDLEASFDE